MSVSAHISELKTRHHKLEAALEDALHHPAASDAEIAELKRRKLQIKDEIERLNHG